MSGFEVSIDHWNCVLVVFVVQMLGEEIIVPFLLFCIIT